MIAFLSSTLLDLVNEREAVLAALRKKRMLTRAMEDFLASPFRPGDTALKNLRDADVMVLVIGFKAGSLLPDGYGATFTSAEYDEAIRLGKEPLVFVKLGMTPGHVLGSWRNEETDPDKKAALDDFKDTVTSRWTPAYFDSPDKLALEVVLALADWEERGRPGARKTFASTADFFAGKNIAGHFQFLDFGTTLLGRDEQLSSLTEFAADKSQRVCILSGRGGIGKSKILHDWAIQQGDDVLFLKDEPLWVDDPEKEIPVDCKTLIVDDAHRQDSLNKLLQLSHDSANHRNLKLILSTRPGSATRLAQQVSRRVDRSQITELTELKELTGDESRLLAEQMLGTDFANYAIHLAEIGSNSPLVIVAGGRLIASRKIDPAALTTLDAFRSTIFDHFLDDMDLQGPRFPVNPPMPLLYLISALGPVDVEASDFRESVQAMFDRPIDEILGTIDQLALVGIVTPRPKPIRILPDVLSDYLLEAQCINAGGATTRYADRVYEFFGAHSLKNLMRNLSELDWRRGRSIETNLKLLDKIWSDIYDRFRAGDEYSRQSILEDLAGAAIYQPDHVISLVRFAIENPISVDSANEGSFFRVGQEHVLAALPQLLEATAHHAEWRRESVSTLWDLTRGRDDRDSSTKSARSVLKRLSAWHRYGDPSLNFSMLVESIRLLRRPDAFSTEFTPFDMISELLEREGEFNEWQDEMTMSVGGFGLNYAAVGPVRESAIDYLEYALQQEVGLAIRAIYILENLLHNFLNRVGRPTTEHELEWQKRERERCLVILIANFDRPVVPLMKAKLFDALRSATAINCPAYIQTVAQAALAGIELEDAVSVVDAICTADHDLPILSPEFSEEGWEKPIIEVMRRGRSSLERLGQDVSTQAQFTIDQTRACLELQMKTGGFHRFMLTFRDRPDFLSEMADHLTAPSIDHSMGGQLSSVLAALHVSLPSAFRGRAFAALEAGATQVIHAAANNLRVFEGATSQDVAVIQAYAGYPDPVAKRGAIFAIAYMGKFVDLRQSLKEAALAIRTEGDKAVAADLADAFGPYGVPLTTLTREEASGVAAQFLQIHDWDFDQAAIPRFLSRFVTLFPDETFSLLLQRIEANSQARASNQRLFRNFGLVHHDISFGGLPPEKRLSLGRDCIARLIRAEYADELAELFWDAAGYDDNALDLVLESAPGLDDQGVRNLGILIDKAIPKIAFSNPAFAKSLLRQFVGEQRKKLVDALAYQAHRFGGGGFAGSPEDYMARRHQQFRDNFAAFPDDPELADLMQAIRRFT